MINLLCKSKRIESTFHFTKVDNLESILVNGLVPRNTLEDECISAKTNDELRLDRCLDANCISIGYPNYKMFYKYRKEPINTNVKWCVIEMKSSVLWEKECKYCTTNAASTCQKDNREGEFNSVSKFKKMFKNIVGKKNRILLRLPKYYTTDPQAEVLVFDTIEPEYIKNIHFEHKRTFLKYKIKREIKTFNFSHGNTYFRPRKDYREWQ